jgi:dynein heavy chain
LLSKVYNQPFTSDTAPPVHSPQGTWQYLEPIFGSEDIMKQMPEEGDKFKTVDQMWRDMMKKTVAAPGCLGIARDKERLARLEEANKLLDAIQKGLASYLEVRISPKRK